MFWELSGNTEIIELFQSTLGWPIWIITTLLMIIAVWSIVWKGIALWKSSKKNHLIWFIVLLIVNTVGILEILYIFIFSEMMGKKKAGNKPSRKSKVKRKKK